MTKTTGIWIQGAGEMASAVASVLARTGFPVVMAEIDRPLAVRRRACFAEAVYAGEATVGGIPGRLVRAEDVRFERGMVAVVVDPLATAMTRLCPVAVVDARMTKRAPAALPRGAAPLIGLGPGFVCGADADLVIETHRDAGPGLVIDTGAAARDTGIPGRVGGHTVARVLRSPAAGNLRPFFEIGDLVRAGQAVGEVGGLAVVSGLDGMLRGLVHPRAELSAGMKVGDVDPRGALADPYAVTDKGLAIGGGVLRALVRLRVSPPVDGTGSQN